MINELTRKNAHIELDHIFKTILPAHGMKAIPSTLASRAAIRAAGVLEKTLPIHYKPVASKAS